MPEDFEPFLIEHESGEILTVHMMFDAEGEIVTDRDEARQFGVIRENGEAALLRLNPDSNIVKVERN